MAEAEQSGGKRRRPGLRLLILSVFIAALAGAVLLPVRSYLLDAVSWIQAHPTGSSAVFIAGYTVATVLMVPGLLLTLSAGFLFGLLQGVVVVSAGSVLGATAAFLVGRFFARDWVRRRLSGMPRFQALDRALQGRAFLIVLLTRLSPLFPFNLLNYALGVTGTPLGSYVLASWIGMLPATVVYVYFGSVAQDLAAIFAGHVNAGAGGRLLFWLGLAATLALTVTVTRIATRALNTELAEAGGPDDG